MNILYTIGYRKHTPDAMFAQVQGLDAQIVDIRYKPWSHDTRWTRVSLAKQYGERYEHMQLLGNPNYRGDGALALLNPDAALAPIAALLEQRPVVLLCGCPDVLQCHRKLAADFLQHALACRVIHLSPKPLVPEGSIPAVSLTPPWGTLVAINAKLNETRSWQVAYRGPLAIHQTKGLGKDMDEDDLWSICHREPFRSTLREHGYTRIEQLPRGFVLATTTLDRIVPTSDYPLPLEPERSFGDYTPGRYVWRLRNTTALAVPCAARGYPALWSWTPPEALTEEEVSA